MSAPELDPITAEAIRTERALDLLDDAREDLRRIQSLFFRDADSNPWPCASKLDEAIGLIRNTQGD